MKRHAPWLIPVLVTLILLTGRIGSAFKPGEMDIQAFGRLPVLHNGRYKPLDSVARVSLLMMRGKQFVEVGSRRQSATAWLLDTFAKPEQSNGIPVFYIHDPDILSIMWSQSPEKKYYSFNDIQPFEKEIHEQAQKSEQREAPVRNRFQRAVLNLSHRIRLHHQLKNSFPIAPNEIDAFHAALVKGLPVFQSHMRSADVSLENKDFKLLVQFIRRYQDMAQFSLFRSMPPLPGEPEEAWKNIGEGFLSVMDNGVVHPDIRVYPSLLDAYRNRDANMFNQKVSEYELRLKKQVSEVVRKAHVESIFNQVQPFYLGSVLYVLAFTLGCLAWVRWRKQLEISSFTFLCLAFVIHTIGLLTRMILEGRPPVTNLYSSAIFVGWAGVLMSLIVERMYKRGYGSIVGAIIGFCTLLIAHHLSLSGDTLEMMQAVLDSNFWLGTHVVTITIGYSSTYLAGALGMVFIVRRFFNALNKSAVQVLYQMTFGVVCFSLLLSFIGTVLGGIWADQSWGRFWGWDPKENGALLIVLWNAIILHARLGGLIQDRGFMVMAVLGTIITSFSWFGVNMLGIGLHSYGFMDKAFFWLMLYTVIQLLFVGMGFVRLPRRKSK